MSINFDRNRTQLLYESLIGVNGPDELLSKRDAFKNYTLKSNDIVLLKSTLKNDAIDFFNSGIISFSEGIDAIFQRRFSWATIKLYYSIFYMIRASMASKGVALLRCGSMFRLIIRVAEKPYNTGNKKYHTTHQGTISHYKDLFAQDDKLLSNKIDEKEAYDWMLEIREIVNYRAVTFKDPECLDVWERFSSAIDNNSIGDLLLLLENDSDYVYCLQEEYAVVGIPIKCVSKTIADFVGMGFIDDIPKNRIEYVKEVFNYSTRELTILETLFMRD